MRNKILRIVAIFCPIGFTEDDSVTYHHLFVYFQNTGDANKLLSILEKLMPGKARLKYNEENSGGYPPDTEAVVVIHIR